MAITFTGTNMTQVTNTGTNIQTVTHTGTVVFTGLPLTASPTLESQVVPQPPFGNALQVRARNNDALTAVIRGYENPPSTSRGNITSGNWTSWIGVGQQGSGGITAYFNAEASGKSVSATVSIYVS